MPTQYNPVAVLDCDSSRQLFVGQEWVLVLIPPLCGRRALTRIDQNEKFRSAWDALRLAIIRAFNRRSLAYLLHDSPASD